MQQYNALNGQSLLDVCLNTYGDLGSLYKLIQDNGVANADASVVSGQLFLWDGNSSVPSGINYATEVGVSEEAGSNGFIITGQINTSSQVAGIYKAVQGQSLLDVCLNTYGDLGYLYKLLEDNGILNADAIVKSGDVFIWDETLVVDQRRWQIGDVYCTEIGESEQTSGYGILTETGFFIFDETGKTLIQE